MSHWLSPITLEDDLVKLVPLTLEHSVDLLAAEQDGNLSELWFTSVPNETTIDAYLDKAFTQQNNGSGLPFAIINKTTNTVIGSTRYCNADALNRRVEIGYTWYAKSAQRTSINTRCKLLLLEYAFEQLNCVVVEFRTHWHNHKSRAAITRLGAKQDGVLRNQVIESDGAIRDTVVFSIIESEWPSVKKSLAFKLSQH